MNKVWLIFFFCFKPVALIYSDITRYLKHTHTQKRGVVVSQPETTQNHLRREVSGREGLHETALCVCLWETVLIVLTDAGNPAHCGQRHSIGRGRGGKSVNMHAFLSALDCGCTARCFDSLLWLLHNDELQPGWCTYLSPFSPKLLFARIF